MLINERNDFVLGVWVAVKRSFGDDSRFASPKDGNGFSQAIWALVLKVDHFYEQSVSDHEEAQDEEIDKHDGRRSRVGDVQMTIKVDGFLSHKLSRKKEEHSHLYS